MRCVGWFAGWGGEAILRSCGNYRRNWGRGETFRAGEEDKDNAEAQRSQRFAEKGYERRQRVRLGGDGAAAIDDEDLAGDEFGLREVGDGAGNILGAAGAGERRAADEIFGDFGGVAGE